MSLRDLRGEATGADVQFVAGEVRRRQRVLSEGVLISVQDGDVSLLGDE
jgi:hypothetical protein